MYGNGIRYLVKNEWCPQEMDLWPPRMAHNFISLNRFFAIHPTHPQKHRRKVAFQIVEETGAYGRKNKTMDHKLVV